MKKKFGLTVRCIDDWHRALTWDQGPALQTGGQLYVLQVCLRGGGGCVHWSSVTVCTWSGPVFWTQRTCLICSPDPQLRLHAAQSSTRQLWCTVTHAHISAWHPEQLFVLKQSLIFIICAEFNPSFPEHFLCKHYYTAYYIVLSILQTAERLLFLNIMISILTAFWIIIAMQNKVIIYAPFIYV